MCNCDSPWVKKAKNFISANHNADKRLHYASPKSASQDFRYPLDVGRHSKNEEVV